MFPDDPVLTGTDDPLNADLASEGSSGAPKHRRVLPPLPYEKLPGRTATLPAISVSIHECIRWRHTSFPLTDYVDNDDVDDECKFWLQRLIKDHYDMDWCVYDCHPWLAEEIEVSANTICHTFDYSRRSTMRSECL